ncbi:MAG TPA: deoxyribonuclease V [Candidatus Krumholzibacterium sp.]|nr:deoxyribonuclease V [Candidatus Krumholzibacterium sp.]
MVTDPEIFRTDLSARGGIELQKRISRLVSERWDGRDVGLIAAADVHFPSKDFARAAITVHAFPGLELIESATARVPCLMPYVPGLLSFREIPAILAALDAVSSGIDLVLCDSHGIAHPRRMGMASHLGLVLDIPTIGCAKSHLFGSFEEPGTERGDRSPVLDSDGEVVGCVLRTRARTRPVYVSTGHMIDLETAVDIVLGCSPRFRIPVPLREAHRLAGR